VSRGGGGSVKWQRHYKERQCNNQPRKMRVRRNERQHDNQTACQKAMAHQEVVAQ
jgi:hypothetical protein